jgi:hypothetical protein
MNKNVKTSKQEEAFSPHDFLCDIRDSGCYLYASPSELKSQMLVFGIDVDKLSDVDKGILESFYIDTDHEDYDYDRAFLWRWYDAKIEHRRPFASLKDGPNAILDENHLPLAQRVIKEKYATKSPIEICDYVGSLVKWGVKFKIHRHGCLLSNIYRGVYGEAASALVFDEGDKFEFSLRGTAFPPMSFDDPPETPEQLDVAKKLVEGGFKFCLDFRKNVEWGFKQMAVFGYNCEARKIFVDKVCLNTPYDELQGKWIKAASKKIVIWSKGVVPLSNFVRFMF